MGQHLTCSEGNVGRWRIVKPIDTVKQEHLSLTYFQSFGVAVWGLVGCPHEHVLAIMTTLEALPFLSIVHKFDKTKI